MPSESVQMVVTSPPYWGLRDYGIEPSIWGGMECEHEWGEETPSQAPDNSEHEGRKYKNEGFTDAFRNSSRYSDQKAFTPCINFCQKCGAWRGQLGLEPTLELYTEHLAMIFREVKRVLRKDGTLWLNLGDSYAGGGKGGHPTKRSENWQPEYTMKGYTPPGVKPKDMIGIPWRVAFALQGDGWYLRSDIIWHKPNPMPESCTDRPTKSHEYIFLLSKSRKYFYDADAIREKSTGQNGLAANFKRETKETLIPNQNVTQHRTDRQNTDDDGTRNKRTIWTIPTQQFPEAHFAVFPEALVEPCIKAGTPTKCCGVCGAPWERVIEKKPSTMNIRVRDAKKGILDQKSGFDGRATASEDEIDKYGIEETGERKTIGWKPTCDHEDDTGHSIVLDPFAGSGTTLRVARNLGRSAIGIDINPEYKKLADGRAMLNVSDILGFDEGAVA